jgi:hypothetical protein
LRTIIINLEAVTIAVQAITTTLLHLVVSIIVIFSFAIFINASVLNIFNYPRAQAGLL